MKINETIKDSIKEVLLNKLGNPTHYYTYFCAKDDMGYELHEEPIKTLDLDARLCGGYNIKVNGEYASESYFMFDKKLAEEFVRKENIEFWQRKIKNCKDWLEHIDEDIIKQKAKKTAEIEIAQKRLAELEGK